MAEHVVRSHRRNRGGPDTFTVWVEGEKGPRRLDENPYYPRGETPDSRLTVAEADALPVSEWAFEIDEIGEGDFVTEPDPREPGSIRRRFVGQIIGYNWRAKNAEWRDRMEITRLDRTALRGETLDRRQLEGQVRYPAGQRRVPEETSLLVVKRSARRRDVGRLDGRS